MLDMVIGALVESAFGTLASAVLEHRVEPRIPVRRSRDVREVHKVTEFWEGSVKPGERVRIAGTVSPSRGAS